MQGWIAVVLVCSLLVRFVSVCVVLVIEGVAGDVDKIRKYENTKIPRSVGFERPFGARFPPPRLSWSPSPLGTKIFPTPLPMGAFGRPLSKILELQMLSRGPSLSRLAFIRHPVPKYMPRA